jgi:hypothetical protein
MGFWDAFKEEYRKERQTEPLRNQARQQVESPRCICEETDEINVVRRENLALSEALRERDAHLEEGKAVIQELAAEVEKLTNELTVRRRSQPKSAIEAKYKNLRRLIVRLVHPDRAHEEPQLRGVLDSICKEVNAEFDRIDAA